MHSFHFYSFVRYAFAISLLFQYVVAYAAPVEHKGRGIFRFAATNGCPLGMQAASDCNRIALDLPQARVLIDETAHTISFSSDAFATNDTVVADVLLQGQGVSETGQLMPLSVMILLRRESGKWSLDSYPRAPVSGSFSQVKLDPYHISVMENGKSRSIFTPEQGQRLFENPGYARRLARAFISVSPSGRKSEPANDLTVSLGYRKLAKRVVRVNFETDPASAREELDQLLSHGNWSIEIDALSGRIPQWAVRRELFLFGLEGQDILAPVERGGLKAGDKLSFGSRLGKGFLRFNGKEAAFSGAVMSGRDFMRDSFMGLIFTWQRTARIAPAGSVAGRSTP